MEKKLNKWSMLAMCIGCMVGAGVVSLVGQAIGITGHSAWLAYGLAVILGVLYNIPVLFVTSSVRLEGGPYALINTLLGKKFAGMYVYSYFLYWPSIAIYAVALGGYVQSLLPNVPVVVSAAVVLTIFYLINLRGMKFLSNFQNVMSTLLIIALMTLILMGMNKVDFRLMFPSTNPNLFPAGFKGVWQACCLLMFSTYGLYLMMYFTRHCENPKKDIPFAIANTAWILLIVYVGVTIVASCVLPLDVVANQPLTYIAQEVLPKPVYIFFMIAGPLMALATTINSVMVSFTEPIFVATEHGWLPKKIAATNKHGVPKYLMTGLWLVSMIPLILGWDLNTITNAYLLVDLLVGVVMMIALVKIPKAYPKAWANRGFFKKAPTGVFYFSVAVAILIQLLIIYNSITSIKLYIVLVTAAVFALGLFIAKKKEADNSITEVVLDFDSED